MSLKVLIKSKNIINMVLFSRNFIDYLKERTVIIYLCFGHFWNMCTINQWNWALILAYRKYNQSLGLFQIKQLRWLEDIRDFKIK